MRSFSGHRAILSGPAGGVVGYARTTTWAGCGPLQARRTARAAPHLCSPRRPVAMEPRWIQASSAVLRGASMQARMLVKNGAPITGRARARVPSAQCKVQRFRRSAAVTLRSMVSSLPFIIINSRRRSQWEGFRPALRFSLVSCMCSACELNHARAFAGGALGVSTPLGAACVALSFIEPAKSILTGTNRASQEVQSPPTGRSPQIPPNDLLCSNPSR